MVQLDLSWTGLESIDAGQFSVQPSVGIAGKGLDLFADAFGASMAAAIDDVDLPGIDSQSLAAALNGVIVEKVRRKELPFLGISQVNGSDQTQIDYGKSVLLRILEAGGIDLDFIGAGGTIQRRQSIITACWKQAELW